MTTSPWWRCSYLRVERIRSQCDRVADNQKREQDPRRLLRWQSQGEQRRSDRRESPGSALFANTVRVAAAMRMARVRVVSGDGLGA